MEGLNWSDVIFQCFKHAMKFGRDLIIIIYRIIIQDSLFPVVPFGKAIFGHILITILLLEFF